jgi:hypothetical protein
MIKTRTPISSNFGVIVSMMAVLPDPTGPPMPMRVIFFMLFLSPI